MIECRGQVRPIPAPADGTSWEVKKGANGIPYLDDATTRKWCISFFMKPVEDEPDDGGCVAGELPNLEVSDEAINTTPAKAMTQPLPAQNPGSFMMINYFFLVELSISCK